MDAAAANQGLAVAAAHTTVEKHHCAICLEDYAQWSMVVTCPLQHSFCKSCAGQLVHGALTPKCPMCRTPMMQPTYYAPNAFAAPKRLPDMSLQEYMTVDLTGPDPLPAGITTLQAVLMVARREAEQGAFTLRQLCQPHIIAELKACTGRLQGAYPDATVRQTLRELRIAGAVDYHNGARGRYVLVA
ncbi:hypothetical protein TrRE_jg745 [Triparma retinervis]|uniref:RING-type domain-containing protein n=1 Tax=Triparma retinervis TaxID=2557542 RepID=A0A9W6ZFP4_9STRA|nr:hypothetical protein TrRE_jg745 [Triparma retinervis]